MAVLLQSAKKGIFFPCIGMIFVVGACASAPNTHSLSPETPKLKCDSRQSIGLHESCRLGSVGGDTRGVATGPHSLLIIGEGIGLLRSEDDGRNFERLRLDETIHWPSISYGRGRAHLSWIRVRKGRSAAVVSTLGRKVHSAVEVFSSKKNLIDTEILVRSNGEIMLMVSEVDGVPNCNRASYQMHCFVSSDGGTNWTERSRAVSGPWGINLEDPRLIEMPGGRILLAYEWETQEGGASRILIQHSDDGGWSWSSPAVLWGGKAADREPGGFYRRNGVLYFVASTDRGSGRSYAGARLAILSSADGGKSWSRPWMPISEIDQLTMGAIPLQDRILLLSLRFYSSHHPVLYLYPIDPLGLWRLSCRVMKDPP